LANGFFGSTVPAGCWLVRGTGEAGTSDTVPFLVVGTRRSWPPVFDSAPGPRAVIVFNRAGLPFRCRDRRSFDRRSASREVCFPSAISGRTVPSGDAVPGPSRFGLFAARSPTLPLAATAPAVFHASRRIGPLRASPAPPPDGSFTGCFLHSGVSGPMGGWLRPGRKELAALPASLMGFGPFAALLRFHGCKRLTAIANPPAVFAADQSRALTFGFVPRIRPSRWRSHRVWRLGLLGFGPVNQPYHVHRRPRYSLSSKRPLDVQGLCCHGFCFLSQVVRRKPNPRVRVLIACPDARAGECKPRARRRRPSFPGRHFWRPSAHALCGNPFRPTLGSLRRPSLLPDASACSRVTMPGRRRHGNSTAANLPEVWVPLENRTDRSARCGSDRVGCCQVRCAATEEMTVFSGSWHQPS